MEKRRNSSALEMQITRYVSDCIFESFVQITEHFADPRTIVEIKIAAAITAMFWYWLMNIVPQTKTCKIVRAGYHYLPTETMVTGVVTATRYFLPV